MFFGVQVLHEWLSRGRMSTSVHSKFNEMKQFLTESWSMGWPMILIMFFHFSIGMADVYVAGYLGTDVMAAVGYVGQLYWALMILANGITVGAVSMISQAYGANSREAVSNVTAHSLVLGVTISGVLTILALAFPASIVRIAGMPDGIQGIAEDFIRIFSLVLIPTYVMIITSGTLRASGRIRVTLINSLVASLVNVAGDLILGFGWGPIPAMGYKGIAWATAGGVTLGMVLNLIFILRGPDRLSLSCLMRPLPRCMRNLTKLGGPSALQQSAWNLGTLVVYFLVGQLRGSEVTALAAMTAGVRIEAIIFLPIFALNMACAVLTGNKLGGGDEAGARYGAKVTAVLSLSIILLPIVAIFVYAPDISSWLTQDQAVLDEMVRYLRINMVGMPFLAVGISLSGALQGAGDTVATMRIVFTGMWLFRIPFILVIIHVFKTSATGVWWAMTVSMILMCGLLINRFRGDAWVKASVDKQNNTMLWEACIPRKPVV